MAPYVLGIDCGNTGIKVALFDLQGHEIGAQGDKVATYFPAPGFTQCDMVQLWHQCSVLIRQLLAEQGVSPEHIAAVGCSGHGNGLYLLDQDQMPMLAIKSLDCRANALVDALRQSPMDDLIQELNRQGVWPAQSATLLCWLKQHQPETYHCIGHVLFCKDYLNFCLTGEIATETGDLSASGLYDFSAGAVSGTLLRALDIEEMVPCIPSPGQCQDVMGHISMEAAALTGLKFGTPVVNGCFDIVACALGSGVWQSQAASIIAGSWSINQVVSDTLPGRDIFMSCDFPGQRYLAVESSATSASNLEWFISQFYREEKQQAEAEASDFFAVLNQQVASTTLTEDLPLFHPYLYGACDNQPVQGNFFGLAGWHQKSDLLYAVYEGIVFGHLEHVSRLRQSGQAFEKAVLSGGAARSPFWSQLFADVLNVDIYTSDCSEAGARGAAMAAATGAGCFTDLGLAVQKMAKLNAPILPRLQVQAVLMKRYARYLAVSLALKNVDLNDI
ncbi:carbohydrate kinase (plasmid) [Photobacterium sp. GJ3]|uniref:FGGY-family carbohydrate kinase n=1 Tax=Photobacterium sp. GJ3 TaxID=2829502 RepID=UPI001B8BAA16|nr:FGGY-family carbohydrate kinase [Photobacterium sp. GJ3]QUJ69994.1 carbohydrate kinase [Photobacterium sp. GJ3]